MLKLKVIISAIFIGFCSVSFSQGYQIKVHIANLPDSTIFLGYYYGDKQYVHDTIALDKKGHGVFKGDKALERGMYFVFLPDKSFFEVVIDKDQNFSLSTKFTGKPDDLIKYLKSEGCTDYQIYIDYQLFMQDKNTAALRIRDKMPAADNKTKKILKDSMEILHNQVKSNWDMIENKYPGSLLASILKINKDIDIPEPPRDQNGNITDSAFQYRYYKTHYFDNIDFADERLLRTSFFHSKIDRYFEKLIIPAPDTVIKESAFVLEKARANNEVFKYTLQLIFNKYNNSNIMGMDKAFVFLAENYYLNGLAPWADSAWLVKVENRVKEIKPNLVGNTAPEIKVVSDKNMYVSLHQLKAEYVVLFFYEPDCGHCRKTTPKMLELSQKYWEKGVEVIGFYTQGDQPEWEKFIKEQKLEHWINVWDPYNQSHFRDKYDIRATPSIYLVNKDKKIIGKRIDVETLEKILEDEYKNK